MKNAGFKSRNRPWWNFVLLFEDNLRILMISASVPRQSRTVRAATRLKCTFSISRRIAQNCRAHLRCRKVFLLGLSQPASLNREVLNLCFIGHAAWCKRARNGASSVTLNICGYAVQPQFSLARVVTHPWPRKSSKALIGSHDVALYIFWYFHVYVRYPRSIILNEG